MHKFAGPVVTIRCFEDIALVKAAVDSSGLVETAEGLRSAVLASAPMGSCLKGR